MQYKLYMLENLLLEAYITYTKPGFPLKNLLDLDIIYIANISFYQQAYKKENISFYTSLYKLDQLIKDKDTQDKRKPRQ